MVKTIKGPVINFKIGLIIKFTRAKIKPVIAKSSQSPLNDMPGTR